ncbi:MAG: hypothetical protein COA97_07285 [Flavobacteriales bacterium]|nr:MAG: hypothetical protein COA97_07285 [Flavobacteriales bacterium]
MKKFTTLCLALVAILFLNNNVNAQAFQKGNINIDLGIGFGIYGTTNTWTTTFNGNDTTVSENDGAASKVFPIGFEYGISDKIGIGADLRYSNYFIDNEDSTDRTESVRAIDFGFRFSFHLLNSDKNDLFIGLGLGYSSVNWKYDTGGNVFEAGSASGSGVYFSLGVTDRIFFSDNIGILFNLSYVGYKYSKVNIDLTSEAEQFLADNNWTFSQEFDWSLKGVNLGIGLAVKF